MQIDAGHMVKLSGAGPLLRVVRLRGDEARCIWIDHKGEIHSNYHDIDMLVPMSQAYGPRSLWPAPKICGDFLANEAAYHARRISEPTGKQSKARSTRPKKSRRLRPR